jgi:hypothetical protein
VVFERRVRPGEPFVVRSARDRRRLTKALGRALGELAVTAAQPGVTTIDVQLVVQVCAAVNYKEWKREVERAWRRQQGGRYSTAQWPAGLVEGQRAALLQPLPAGRVGLAAGRQPKLVATPQFAYGDAGGESTNEDAALGLVTSWAANPRERHSARLSPPVLELVQRGRVVARELVTFGLDWPLPAPDGL